ncbi:hypothetical protein IWQ60_003810 [Tieghemiomyces parasiticus]|uniref:Uncharacterized protein n=1 Tax=Tieghemiomyces parasiticus TaxID=78921 RepID=A0A9W8AGW9_9FUNG|nr:hypothetical protein IWQ60_003810 [Tieghemiomyces parasiticus]
MHPNRYPDSVGILLPNVEAKILDEEGRALGYNQTGELCIRGPNVMKGYLNNPQATAETIDSEGFLHTGDVGHVNRAGYFFITDRKKELIKYKGFQVAPAELEALLLTHPKVLDAVVVGVEDQTQATEVPKAFVVPRVLGLTRETSAALSGELTKFVQDRVANHKKLRGGVEFLLEIPKSASGKVLRRVVRNQARATISLRI